MTGIPLALVSLAAGAVLGVAITITLVLAVHHRRVNTRFAAARIPTELSAAIAAFDDATAIVDNSLSVRAASPSAAWLGLRPGALVEQDGLAAIVRAARGTGMPQTQTMRVKRGRFSDDARLIVAKATRVGDWMVLLTIRDISEQERLQQTRQDFIANTSHELKTPVGAIGLLAEAMEEASDDPDQLREFAARMAAEARRLGDLTTRIMNLSKLQAADELAENSHVVVDEVVSAAISQYSVAAASAEVRLVRGGEKRTYVRGSSTILTEAVGNLIANAIAYSPRGSRVGIGVRTTADAVEIAVSDQGIGISEADQARVFERFYRADQARSRRTGGTGLGLSIVKHAVSRHGGDVRLWSQPERGSTFTIRLPRVSAPGAEDGGFVHKMKSKLPARQIKKERIPQ